MENTVSNELPVSSTHAPRHLFPGEGLKLPPLPQVDPVKSLCQTTY